MRREDLRGRLALAQEARQIGGRRPLLRGAQRLDSASGHPLQHQLAVDRPDHRRELLKDAPETELASLEVRVHPLESPCP